MNSTARRVPRMTGLPARTSGSTTMRSESGIPTVYRANTGLGRQGLFDLISNPGRPIGSGWCSLVVVGNWTALS